MSKIEKALNKARAERGHSSVPVPVRSGTAGEGHLVPVSTVSVQPVDTHDSGSHSIALMQETVLRAPGDLAESGIIHSGMGENSTVRTFREIRTRILQRSHGKNGVLMVTGVSGKDGGTFVALNLGAVFAFDPGKTALVLDCNLRNPWMERFFADQPVVGLTDYLEDSETKVAQIIHSIGVERLRVIPAGGKRGTVTEYFTSPRMKQLIESIRRRYAERFIIIDAPPMSESADTHILADLCDYVVLVVPYGKVTGAQLENCVRAIDSKKFLGVIFNDEPQLPPLRWDEMLPPVVLDLIARGTRAFKALRNATKRK